MVPKVAAVSAAPVVAVVSVVLVVAAMPNKLFHLSIKAELQVQPVLNHTCGARHSTGIFLSKKEPKNWKLTCSKHVMVPKTHMGQARSQLMQPGWLPMPLDAIAMALMNGFDSIRDSFDSD